MTNKEMTNEEAIARIREHKIVHRMGEPRAIYISEALDMAIKALEQQPCEDCISRHYVEDIVEELENICHNAPQEVLELLAKIKNAPPVIPQQPIGRWMHNKCDKCGASRPPLFDDFCPNCRAKMKEVKE